MSCSQKEVCLTFFQLKNEFTENGKKKGNYECQCGISRVQEFGKGWGNLFQHITSSHPDYLDRMKSINMAKSNSFDSFINKGASNAYNWIELIVMCNLPFSFVENEYIRKGMKYDNISVDTLMKYIWKLTTAVEEEVSNHLPEKFGLIVDAWSENLQPLTSWKDSLVLQGWC